MKHRIPIYQSDPKGMKEGPTPLFALGALSLIICFVLAFFVPWYFASIPWWVHSALWLTNERYNMTISQAELWQKYRSLSKETQESIDLPLDYIKSLEPGPAMRDIEDSLVNLRNREREIAKYAGADAQVRDRINLALNERIKLLKHEENIVKEVAAEQRKML